MKKLILPLMMLLSLVMGCKKGEKGDPGQDGTANLITYTGAITSDNHFVNAQGYGSSSLILVYISDSSTTLQLPFYSSSLSTNVTYTPQVPNVVRIHNALSAGGLTYKIIIINQPGSSSSFSKIMG